MQKARTDFCSNLLVKLLSAAALQRDRSILDRLALASAVVVLPFFASCASIPTTGGTFRDCPECPLLIVVRPGSALLGGSDVEHVREAVPDAVATRERPQQSFTLPSQLAVGQFEITRGEYALFVAATGRAVVLGCHVLDLVANTWGLNADRSWRAPGFTQTDTDPVVCVSWDDARAYTAWLTASTGHEYRLLTEAEWEYAARGRTTTARYWGDTRENACAHANVADLTLANLLRVTVPLEVTYFQCRDGIAHTAPVGSFPANPFGLYDMAGNVWEWTASCESATSLLSTGKPGVGLEDVCAERINRGGSWVNSPMYLRIAARHKDVATMRNTVLGFRVARSFP